MSKELEIVYLDYIHSAMTSCITNVHQRIARRWGIRKDPVITQVYRDIDNLERNMFRGFIRGVQDALRRDPIRYAVYEQVLESFEKQK